VTNYINPKN